MAAMMTDKLSVVDVCGSLHLKSRVPSSIMSRSIAISSAEGGHKHRRAQHEAPSRRWYVIVKTIHKPRCKPHYYVPLRLDRTLPTTQNLQSLSLHCTVQTPI